MRLSLIAAVGRNKEIGYQGALPWNLTADLANFKRVTRGHSVIMGRKTHESIGRPLPERVNIVISRNADYSSPGVLSATSLEDAVVRVPVEETEAFIIGGAGVYAEAIALVVRMYLTEVDYSGEADTFFPKFNPDDWNVVSSEQHPKSEKNDFAFSFVVYDRKVI
jgi:dihydrofolate reductase